MTACVSNCAGGCGDGQQENLFRQYGCTDPPRPEPQLQGDPQNENITLGVCY